MANSRHSETFAYHPPKPNELFLSVENVNIPLCLNGKKVSLVTVNKGATQAEMEAFFLADEKIKQNARVAIKKFIYVPDRLFNAIVIKS